MARAVEGARDDSRRSADRRSISTRCGSSTPDYDRLAHAVRRARVPHAGEERRRCRVSDADASTASRSRRADDGSPETTRRRRVTHYATVDTIAAAPRQSIARARQRAVHRRRHRNGDRSRRAARRRPASLLAWSASRSPWRRARRTTFPLAHTAAQPTVRAIWLLGDDTGRRRVTPKKSRAPRRRAEPTSIAARALAARRARQSRICRRSTVRRDGAAQGAARRSGGARRRRRTRSTTCSRFASRASRCADSTSTR